MYDSHTNHTSKRMTIILCLYAQHTNFSMIHPTLFIKVIFVPHGCSLLVKDDLIPQRISYHTLLSREHIQGTGPGRRNSPHMTQVGDQRLGTRSIVCTVVVYCPSTQYLCIKPTTYRFGYQAVTTKPPDSLQNLV
jgi:hypothetical protein